MSRSPTPASRRLDPLKERDLYRPCGWCGRINCHAPNGGKTCRCHICRGAPTTAQFKKAIRFAYRTLLTIGEEHTRKRIREILGDWR
jgi:hypothetical protein